jgi:dienelactone hydrolase
MATEAKYSVEKGSQPSSGARYELYLPKNEGKVPAVLLLHGFQCRLDYHRGTAGMLAENGIACLIVDMLPLMSLFHKTLHKLREKNAQATIGYVDWLNDRKEVDKGRIILAGYSAGGGVAMETGSALVGKHKIRAVLLLDAVPYVPLTFSDEGIY